MARHVFEIYREQPLKRGRRFGLEVMLLAKVWQEEGYSQGHGGGALWRIKQHNSLWNTISVGTVRESKATLVRKRTFPKLQDFCRIKLFA